MTIDGLALQELREIIESIAEQSDGDWLGAADARLILALMDERDAALRAEVERLRGALIGIEHYITCWEAGPDENAENCRALARAALQQREEQGE